jgi:hypothetical protein
VSEEDVMDKKIPKRVKIYDKWYDVSDMWPGRLDLNVWMTNPEYFAREPYAHMNDFYFVYDTKDNKVGEFHIINNTYSGCVTGFEI